MDIFENYGWFMAPCDGGSYLRLYRCNDRPFNRSKIGANRFHIGGSRTKAQILFDSGKKYAHD